MHSFSIPSLFILFFLFTTLSSSSSSTAASVEETCKSITSVRPDVGYDFCVASLGSNPDSSSADPDGLAVIAIRLSIANATAVASKIESLMQGEDQSDPSLRDCLGVCAEVYSEAVDHLNRAVASIRSRSYGDAVTFLSAALDAADNCEDAFGDFGWTSPLAAEDRNYGRLADIALAIGASLGR